MIGAASDGDEIVWWENNGSENFIQHSIEDAFDCAYGLYAADIADLGFDLPPNAKYGYTISAADATTFTALATDNGSDADLVNNVWSIDENGDIVEVTVAG